MEKISGAELKRRMTKYAVSPHELALAANVEVLTVLDYMRDSRSPTTPIVAAITVLTQQLDARMQRAREHLLHSYQAHYQICRNPPGVQLPEMSAIEAEQFCSLSFHPPKVGIPEKVDEGNQSFAEWVKALVNRLKSFYNSPSRGTGGFVLHGEPGGGKTTALRLFLTKTEHFEHLTPAFLPLPQLGAANTPRAITESVVRYLTEKHWSPELPSLREFLEREFQLHRLIYVFDGLDEIKIELRRQLLHRLKSWKTPYLLAGRATLPRISDSLPLANAMFVDKLPVEKIQDFLRFRANQLELRGDEQALQNVNRLAKMFETRSQLVDSGDDLEGMLSGIAPTGSAFYRRRCRSDNEIVGLLGTPATLNIVVDFVAKGIVHGIPSAEFLLDKYVEFLSERWWKTRRADFEDSEDDEQSVLDRTDFVRILGAVSWLAEFKSYHQPDLSIAELSEQVEALLADWRGESNPSEHFHRAMIIAVDAQLLDLEAFERGKIRFRVSHELFLSYFAGNFIANATSHAATLSRDSQFRSAARIAMQSTEGQARWALQADYYVMLSTPTLGVARDALFFFLTTVFNSRQYGDGAGEKLLTFLTDFPRISTEDAGVDQELIDSIIPGNKIVAWRTLASKELSNRVKGTRLDRELIRLGKWLRETYRRTNFEYVFEAIFRSCGRRLIENTQKDTDEGWRFCKNFGELKDWMREVGCIDRTKDYLVGSADTSFSRDLWKLRRSVYKIRYFIGDINDEMICLLRDICSLESQTCEAQVNEARRKDAVGLANMAKGTARILSLACPSLSDQGTEREIPRIQISDDNLNWLDEINRSAENNDRLLKQWEARMSAAVNARDFFQEYINAPEVRFGSAEGHFGNIFLFKSNDWFRELADSCITSLEAFQVNSDSDSDSDSEVKILELIMCIASSHQNRMFFLPHRYSLAAIGLSEPPQGYCDNECRALKVLFRGAAQGVSPIGTDHDDLVQSGTRSSGQFQVYDYYVRAIWRLLQEDPSTLVGV